MKKSTPKKNYLALLAEKFSELILFINKKKPSIKDVKIFLKHYFGGLYDRTDKNHLFLIGGGLAFSILICMIPFILIIFSIAGLILESATLEQQINVFIDTILPYDEYANFAKNIIFSRIEEVVKYKNLAGIIGIFGLLFASSSLFSSMRTVLSTIFNLPEDTNILISKLKDFGLVLLVILLFFFSTILLPLFDILRQTASEFEFLDFLDFGEIGNLLLSFASFFFIFFVFSLLYYAVPVGKMRKRVILLSAFWAAFLWEIAKQVFGYYIANFGGLGRIYGTYVLVIVVVFWIYYSSIIFIIGAEIGQLFRERLQEKANSKQVN